LGTRKLPYLSSEYTKYRRAHSALLTLAGLVLGALPWPARAQQASPTPGLTQQQLNSAAHNPFVDFFKLPIESDTGFSIGPHHNAGDQLSSTPVIPFRLTTNWDLILRPEFSVTYEPSPHEQFGLNDAQVSLFLTPNNESEWIWGIGPILQLPTATSNGLGTGRCSAGPTAGVVYSKGPWFNYILAYQLMSFAGDRDRGSVDQTYVEPELSYSLDSGWYGDIDPSITFDWTADEANGWTVPMGADLGKSFNWGTQAISPEIGAYDLLQRPAGAPQWFIRVQLQFLFPAK
jgi:hypothetical protein